MKIKKTNKNLKCKNFLEILRNPKGNPKNTEIIRKAFHENPPK